MLALLLALTILGGACLWLLMALLFGLSIGRIIRGR